MASLSGKVPKGMASDTSYRIAKLRGILTEVCRVRKAPSRCTSINALCRSMMNISLHTREPIRAAVAAIKMLDPNWRTFVPDGVHKKDSSFHAFMTKLNGEHCSHPMTFISSNMTQVSFSRGLLFLNLFDKVLDATKASAMISVLLENLREDLKEHIPEQDKELVQSYSVYSYGVLNQWHLELTQSGFWYEDPPLDTNHQVEHADIGIANHTGTLVHPYRSTWSWKYSDPDSELSEEYNSNQQLLCKVRSVGPWNAPLQATTRILLMVMAFFNEPCCIWLRDGSFHELHAAIEVLHNAEEYGGTPNYFYHCRVPLPQLGNCVQLYEGMMGAIGADDINAKEFYNALRSLIITISEKYAEYKSVLHTYPSSRTSSFSS